MIRLELSGPDAAALAAVIESELSDLRYEISNTDSLDYREMLRHKKAALLRIQEQLSVPRQMV